MKQPILSQRAGSRLCGAQPPTRGRNEMAGRLRADKHTELGGRMSPSLCSKLMSFPSSELPLLHGALTDTYEETRGRILAAAEMRGRDTGTTVCTTGHAVLRGLPTGGRVV